MPTAPVTPATVATAALVYLGFILALFVLSLVVPGPLHDGAPLPDGTRVRYRLSGFRIFLITALAAALGTLARPHLLAGLHRLFFPLLVAANVFAFTMTYVLYLKGRASGAVRAGGLGALLRDCFYGAELNPTILGVDLKLFSYRPSLLLLGLLNVSFAVAQHQIYGEISARMWLYQIFYFLYLANYFQFEYGMIFTWDIIAERFGWMLVWGDYVLVPFFYCLPGWYLLHNRAPLSGGAAAALIGLYALGFWLFRGSNEQKHRFKMDPRAPIWGQPAEALGGKLLCSGFWGIGRKLNYTGELCVYFAWTLTCGFDSIVPYLLPLWLAVLFPHRAWRDDRRCAAKYGPLWTEYCARARFRMIPFLY